MRLGVAQLNRIPDDAHVIEWRAALAAANNNCSRSLGIGAASLGISDSTCVGTKTTVRAPTHHGSRELAQVLEQLREAAAVALALGHRR